MIRQTKITELKIISKMYIDANPSCTQDTILRWTKKEFGKYAKYYFVYEIDKNIVGTISGILQTKSLGVINDIAIIENYRNKKIGTKLINHLLKKFKQDKIKKISLCVCWQNAAAIPFYYRLGFRFKKFGQEDNEDVIYLEKKLI